MGATSNLSIVNNYSNGLTTGTGGTLTDSFSDNSVYALTSGTGAGQIDLPWSASNSLTNAAATYTLSALAGPGSGTTALAHVKKIYLHNTATADGNSITIAPGVTHGWNVAFAGAVTVPAGGCFVLAATVGTGWNVTSGSLDQVTITATGTVPYKFSLEGTSA